MRIWPLIATHTLVATAAWLNGWLSGVWAERRRDEEATRPAPPIRIIDLTSRRAYDWAVDGECVWAVFR